jgi:hypothetical protein
MIALLKRYLTLGAYICFFDFFENSLFPEGKNGGVSAF